MGLTRFRPVAQVTSGRSGLMPPALYAELTGEPPTDPSAEISTAGATGSYIETSVTNIASSLDSSVTGIRARTCYSTRHVAGQATLVPTLFFPGLNRSATDFTDAWLRTWADYYHPTSGLSLWCHAFDSRGRGSVGGTVDYVRDTIDRYDAYRNRLAALGTSNVFAGGNALFLVGYSTGVLDMFLFALRFPDLVGAMAGYWPNFDIREYWDLIAQYHRDNYLTPSIGDLAQGSQASLDPYLARSPRDGLTRLLAMPGAPHLWLFADNADPAVVPLPDHNALIREIRPVRAASAKLHTHVSQAGNARRWRHGDGTVGENAGISGADNTWARRYFVPTVLSAVAAKGGIHTWTFPTESPPEGYRVFGFLRTRTIEGSADQADDRAGMQLWLGASATPRASIDGGKVHAAEVAWLGGGRQLDVRVVTSRPGHAEAWYGEDARTVQIGAAAAEASTDYTMFNSGASLVTIPETNTSATDAFEGNGITGLRVATLTKPASWVGGDAVCVYTDRFGLSRSYRAELDGLDSGEVEVPLPFVCTTLTVQNTSAGSDAGRALAIKLRPVAICADAPVHAIQGVWDQATGPLEIVAQNLTEGWAEVAGPLTGIVKIGYVTEPLENGTITHIDMSVTPDIPSLSELGVTWLVGTDGAAGLTGSSPVTAWAPQIGTGTVTSEASNEPATGTDGNGKTYVAFTAASQHRLGVDADLVDLNGDWVMGLVCTLADTNTSRLLDIAHVQHNTGGYTSILKAAGGGGVTLGLTAYYDGPVIALDNDVGNNTSTISTTTPRLIVIQRRGDEIQTSLDGSEWDRVGVVTGTFATTNLRLTLGAWYANSIDGYASWSTTRVYSAFLAAGTSWTRTKLLAAWKLLRNTYAF